jgi:hypothetical protein
VACFSGCVRVTAPEQWREHKREVGQTEPGGSRARNWARGRPVVQRMRGRWPAVVSRHYTEVTDAVAMMTGDSNNSRNSHRLLSVICISIYAFANGNSSDPVGLVCPLEQLPHTRHRHAGQE